MSWDLFQPIQCSSQYFHCQLRDECVDKNCYGTVVEYEQLTYTKVGIQTLYFIQSHMSFSTYMTNGKPL